MKARPEHRAYEESKHLRLLFGLLLVVGCPAFGFYGLWRIMRRPIVRSLRFSPDSTLLAAGGGFIVPHDGDDLGGRVWLWSVKRGSLEQKFSSPKNIAAVDFLRSTAELITWQYPETYTAWDVQTGQSRLVARARSFLVSAQDRRITLALSEDSHWNVRLQKIERIIKTHPQEQLSVVALSPEESKVALLDAIGNVQVWNTDTSKQFLKIALQALDNFRKSALSPDGKTLAIVEGAKIRIWDLTTGKPIKTVSGYADRVYLLAFSPDGKKIASSDSVKFVNIADVQTSRIVQTFELGLR